MKPISTTKVKHCRKQVENERKDDFVSYYMRYAYKYDKKLSTILGFSTKRKKVAKKEKLLITIIIIWLYAIYSG